MNGLPANGRGVAPFQIFVPFTQPVGLG